ncbi:MAG: hypothetical protein HXX08_05875 [Chloroflexi bacterium]|uniref:Queuosine 5'-phosphate N-glycosylase/hydrolase n=1 Tax=Candidatus Chlorohelix allophototropha TaxID=3003348 RepID=A0A8T7M0L0_9CHLR|nr:hypothetical protein [Chloroflexota bacterium]WJW67262.1 queuosine salvage family protein [Chloroflexota bacterium L227-S17]
MYELVRESAGRVLEKARYICLNRQKLADFAATIDPREIQKRYTYEDDFHLLETAHNPELQLDYVMTVDAINFGSGFSPLWKAQFPRQQSLYMTVASGLKRYVEQGGKLDASFAASVTPTRLAELFGVSVDFPLMAMFAESLNQLGNWVMAEYGGSYAGLLNRLTGEKPAAELIGLLAQKLSCFDDSALYHGEKVYFLKRAQILANDLYLAFEGKGYGRFPDIAHLTMFADNLVPHVFRIEGALEYDHDLLARIEKGEALEAGSLEEIEIRAAGIVCVEEVTNLLGNGLFPAMVDVYLWHLGQAARYKSYLRHLTRTYFY